MCVEVLRGGKVETAWEEGLRPMPSAMSPEDSVDTEIEWLGHGRFPYININHFPLLSPLALLLL